MHISRVKRFQTTSTCDLDLDFAILVCFNVDMVYSKRFLIFFAIYVNSGVTLNRSRSSLDRVPGFHAEDLDFRYVMDKSRSSYFEGKC